jgi:Tol biopolymer transport system component/tRNA A-37 threonylcarbamoyl transferase component Bud32
MLAESLYQHYLVGRTQKPHNEPVVTTTEVQGPVAQEIDSVVPAAGGRDVRRVGTFEILDEIGRGGMGIVYRARDTKLRRVVALKRPKPELLDRPDLRRRFMTEARSASKLMHPHITTVFEVFEEDGVPWLVMELIDGASLRSMLSDGDPLPCEEVMRHAEGLTDALRAAHVGGVLHRDINPNNVLIGTDGRARLNDFGLAGAWAEAEISSERSADSTEVYTSGRVAGTRGYMSPEQALGKPVDPRSDIFSLGVVLYEMCAGRPAFLRRESSDWMDLLLHREPEPISQLNSEVPIEFEQIVDKALAKRVFQRYQSANEMLLDLRAVRKKLSTDSGFSPPSFEMRRRRRNRWIAATVAALGVVAVAAVLMAVLMPTHRPPTLGPKHRRLTAGAGWEGQPAISPDGTMIAYTSDSTGSPDLWVIRADGGDPLQLTSHPGSDTDPAWFPDGSAIAFVSDRDGGPGIWRMPPLGGSAVKLLTDGADPAISPDGTRVAFTRAGPDGQPRIAVAPLGDPSEVRVLTDDGDGFWSHTSPTWSPDGRTLCYADHNNLWLVPAVGGEAKRLTNADAVDRNPVWSPDGRYIFFSSDREETPALWCLRVTDGSMRRLSAGTSVEGEPSLDRNGQRLAYSTTDDNPDIVVLDRTTGLRSKISGATDEVDPAVAPHGTSVAFISDRRGGYDLWLQPLQNGRPDGSPHRLTDHRGSVAVPAFSPDGRWLAYHRVLDGQRDVWIVPVAGGVAQRFTEHPAADFNPSFSPDGSTVAFVSDRSGSENIWVASVVDGRRRGKPRQITAGEAVHWFPVWSRDGRKIACVVQRGYESEISVFDIGSEAPPVQVTSGAGAHRVQWVSTGDELLVSGTWGTDRISLRLVSLSQRSSRPFDPGHDLGPSEVGAGMFGWDGARRILAYEVIERRGDVWLAETDLGRRWAVPWR